MAAHNLVELLDPVFQGDLHSFDKRHVVYSRGFCAKNVRALFDDQEVERRGPN